MPIAYYLKWNRFFLLFCLFLLEISNLTGQAGGHVLDAREGAIYLQQADSLYEKGQTERAMTLVEKAQTIFEDTEHWEEYVKCFLKIAELFAATDSEKRAQALDQMLLAAKKHLPEGHQYQLEALRSKGEFFIDASQLDSAKIMLSAAIDLGRKSEQWEELTWALIIKGVVAYYEEDFVRMEESIEDAQWIAETKLSNPIDHLAMITQLQAILFEATGNYEKAFIAAQKTLKRERRKALKTKSDSSNLANVYNTQGAIYYERGDYDQAIHYYKVALDLHQKIKSDPPTLVGINNNIAISFKRKTDWKQVHFYLEASKSLLPDQAEESNFEDWIRTEQLLALNLVDQGKFAEAIHLLKKLLPISKQYEFNENWNFKTMGNALMKNGQAEKARQYFHWSLEEMQSIYGIKHPNIAALNRLIGDSYLDQSEFDAALHFFQKALLALCPNFKDSLGFSNPGLEEVIALPELLPTLKSKANALMQLSKTDPQWKTLTLETYRLAIATIDKIREHHETEEAKLLLSTNAKEIYEGSIQFLYQEYAQNQDQYLLLEAFQYAEKSKSLLLLEMIRSAKARQKINPLYASDSLFYSLLEKGKQVKTELLFFEQKLAEAQQTKEDIENPKVKNAETALARLYQKNLQWKNQMQSLYPEYYNLQYDQSFADLPQIQEKLLEEGALFLEYFIGQESSFLFVVTIDKIQLIQLPDRNTLDSVHQEFYQVLQDREAINTDAQKAYTDYNAVAYRCYKMLLEDALNPYLTKTNKLIIVPDALLNNVPFEALNTRLEQEPSIDFGKLPYLLNEVQIHYGYSATLLISNQNRQQEIPANVSCLALAPPYAEQEFPVKGSLKNLRSEYAPLSGTSDEILSIAQYFPGQYDRSATATESFFKQEAVDFGILHLAMHGVANFDNSNFAHLNFTNVSTDPVEDNLLHHYEIANMNFNAQLATLSACETGLGKYEEGEGVFSLARSFMYAGVPSVVMSLWKIDDQSTSQLMPLFYENLAAGLEKDAALQKAKKLFLKEADLENKHPYFWSGMVLLGDEQALKRKPNRTWWYWGGLVFLLGLLFFFRKPILDRR